MEMQTYMGIDISFKVWNPRLKKSLKDTSYGKNFVNFP